ncbi:MAG: twin-arginine translocation signal domain-containing protein, partial [Acidiferrobacteraceae bacterium]
MRGFPDLGRWNNRKSCHVFLLAIARRTRLTDSARRQFLKGAGGASVVALAVGLGLIRPAQALDKA